MTPYTLFIILFSALAIPFAMVQTQNLSNGEAGVAASAEEICPIKVGARIPSVSVKTIEGEAVELTSAVAKKPTVLIFYRGGWCVYCNAQLQQLRTIEPTLRGLGYQLIAVSPDRSEKLRESLDKHSLGYTLLSDSKLTAAKQFGLVFRVADQTLQRYKTFNIDLEDASGELHHLLPVPAVFIVGMDGTIRFSYVNPNYRVRLDPDILLMAAKTALK